jgi:capsular polysaccharide transport system ATP-binding protein
MIEIRNLYKRYHNHHGSDWVLKNINLTIPPNVSVGLIGANGAGKSTLLRLIAGMDKPERGEVIRHTKVSWPVGLSGGMQKNMTARQNVKFVARVHGSSSEDVKRVIKYVEEFAEIGSAFDEPVRTFSSGMRSRISFGLSLAFDFDVYISDEATAVGDKNFKAKAKAAFREKTGKASLIMVSHSEGILRELCQAGIFINKGEATWFDSIDDAIEAYHQAHGLVESAQLKQTRQEVKALRKVFRDASAIYKDAKDSNSMSSKEVSELRREMESKRKALHKAKAELRALQEANDDE